MSTASTLGTEGVALIVGAGPGISASCARLFAESGFAVALAARNPSKPELKALEASHGTRTFGCNAASADDVATLFRDVEAQLGRPVLVVHNIDGRIAEVFQKPVNTVSPDAVWATLHNAAYSAFLVGQLAAQAMLENAPGPNGGKGTYIITNASAALKGFPKGAAFAMACQAKAGLAESMARELGPQGIHIVNVPIDCAIGRLQDNGTRAHWLAGETVDDNMADPDRIAEVYLQLHRQHRSTWTNEVVLRPWTEKW
ncbi:MAG: SDR family oxidoreductase [Novosphingobium sp.]|uniref:SDR family oxidoreductase n=1 Tax=Novosphingobium sp. TaxID=1874826 RepID=UPI0030163D1C